METDADQLSQLEQYSLSYPSNGSTQGSHMNKMGMRKLQILLGFKANRTLCSDRKITCFNPTKNSYDVTQLQTPEDTRRNILFLSFFLYSFWTWWWLFLLKYIYSWLYFMLPFYLSLDTKGSSLHFTLLDSKGSKWSMWGLLVSFKNLP